MRALLYLAVAGALAAGCGDNVTARDDAAPSPTFDAPTEPADGPPVNPAGPCLDRSTDLPRPSTTLPCDLLPPGFAP